MTTTHRTSVLVLFIVVIIGIAEADIASSPHTAAPPGVELTSGPLSIEQQELVDFARSRFDRAGLELPDVAIEFPEDEGRCYGYGGVYLPSEYVVRICRPSKTTAVHELAHAWAETTLDADDRAAFLRLRGLQSWTGAESWEERGAEQAAEIITWGIMDEDITVPWLTHGPDGSTSYSWRLFKVPDSDPARLVEAYELLTGELPSLRVLDEPCDATPEEITSPEAHR